MGVGYCCEGENSLGLLWPSGRLLSGMSFGDTPTGVSGCARCVVE